MPHRVRSVVYGAAAGGLLGLCGLALLGSRLSLGSVEGVLLDPATSRGRADFMISSGGLYMTVLIFAMLGGLLIAGIAYAFGGADDPQAARFPLRYLLPAAAITAAVVGYAILRVGLGSAADIEAGLVTISTFRMIVLAMVAGAAAGGATASVVDALARPGVLGFEGEAVPASPAAFMKEAVSAIGTATMALIIIAIFAIGLSQILLSLHGIASVVAFALVAALVLGGAALVAYRPWDRSSAPH